MQQNTYSQNGAGFTAEYRSCCEQTAMWLGIQTMASAPNRQLTILPKYVRVERDSQRVLWFIEMLTVY
jgi:hypothetical protein